MNISEIEKKKWNSGAYKKEIKVEFPNKDLTLFNSDVYGESLTLKESLFDGNDAIEIVGCISNQLTLEIRHRVEKLQRENIIVSIRIDEGDWIKLFTGYVDSIETVRNKSWQKIICYDLLQKYQNNNFYNSYSTLPASKTIKSVRDKLFDYIGISQVETTLPNDNVSINTTFDNKEISVISALKAICQSNGVFGIINRDGQFEYRKISNAEMYLGSIPSTSTFPSFYPGDVTLSGGEYVSTYESIKYNDYITAKINKVVVRDSENDTSEGIYQVESANNPYLIQGNIWLKNKSKTTKEAIAQNIYNNVKDIAYRPFEATNLGLPWYELGTPATYYVYDFSSGQAKTTLIVFYPMVRYLKGIQWLKDTLTSNGDEFQPEVKKANADNSGVSLDDVSKKIDEKIEELSEDDLILTPDNVDDFIDSWVVEEKIVVPDNFDDYYNDAISASIDDNEIATPDSVENTISDKVADGTLASGDDLPCVVFGTSATDTKAKLKNIYTTSSEVSEGSSLENGCLLLVYE